MEVSALERTQCEHLLFAPGDNKFFHHGKNFDPVLAMSGVIMSINRSPPLKIAPSGSETKPALSEDPRSGSAQIQTSPFTLANSFQQIKICYAKFFDWILHGSTSEI
jgi:hypothetical protein